MEPKTAQQVAALCPTNTSVGTKMLNLFVSPGLVFEEVAVAPPKLSNWLIPAILVGLSSLLVLKASSGPDQMGVIMAPYREAGRLTSDQAATLSAHWKTVSGLAICVGAFAGTFWSALVIWLISRVLLKTRFAYWKAVEVVGLSGTVLILGGIVTALLISATGDPAAKPALSLICGKLQPGNRLREAADLLDCFQLWTIGVMTVGLSRLCAVTIKESAFWVLGYWLVLRTALVMLA